MPLAINPLPQFEADLATHLKEKEDREAYEKLNAPTTMVVRFGYLRMIGEFPYSGTSKPGCGSKVIVRTHRGTEIGEMLTSTCRNSGCSKSVTRKEMLQYIENSGGRQYPFFDRGKALRIANVDDLNKDTRNKEWKNELRQIAKEMIGKAGLEMSIIEAEPLLGNERVIFYFSSEDRIDFRDLVQELQVRVGTKVEMRQIGARDEARITADYERCGQYCCCKSFLKVLKPVSMKSAKTQKATLDPLKISGRCGRLMCCLRYEDETYDELRKNLPHRKSRVGTPEGDGIVISTQILTQLALIRLDNGTDVAIPVEDLGEPEHSSPPAHDPRGRSGRGGSSDSNGSKNEDSDRRKRRTRSKKQSSKSKAESGSNPESSDQSVIESSGPAEGQTTKKKRRRRRKRTSSSGESGSSTGTTKTPQQNQGKKNESSDQSKSQSTNHPSSDSSGQPKKKRKRRRRRKPSDGSGGGSGGSSGGSNPPENSGS